MSQPIVDTKPLFQSSLRRWQEQFRATRGESATETAPESREKKLIPRRRQKLKATGNK